MANKSKQADLTSDTEGTSTDATAEDQAGAPQQEPTPAPAWEPRKGGDCSVHVVLGGPIVKRCPGVVAKVHADGRIDADVRLPGGKVELRTNLRPHTDTQFGDGFDAPMP